MKNSAKLLVWVAIATAVAATGHAQTWHSTEGPRKLMTDSSRILVKLADPGISTDVLYAIPGIADVSENFVLEDFVVCSLATNSGYEAFLDSVRSVPEVYLVEPYYLSSAGVRLLVGETFCVRFKAAVSQTEIDDINKSYGVTVDYRFGGKSTLFILKNSPLSGYGTLELANLYHELPETELAHPDFGVPIVFDSYDLYDRYSPYQYQIKKVIGTFNEASVWDFAGLTQDIIVAVIDDGVEAHEDLPAERILPGVDLVDVDNDPSPVGIDFHGQACAGIIAASHTLDSVFGWHDSTGVISMNPQVKILPIKLFMESEQVSPPYTAWYLSRPGRAIDTAWEMGADIISCSWHIISPWDKVASVTEPINEGITNALSYGRDSLGTPVVFASGNGGYHQLAYPASHDLAFSVGATDSLDQRFDYSQYDAADTLLDVVAPSGEAGGYGDMWTLDCMGTKGRNYVVGIDTDTLKGVMTDFHPKDIFDCPPGQDNLNYMCAFGGTSGAAPVVAGTMSLLLSRDPTLYARVGWENSVYDIIRMSAVPHQDEDTVTRHPEYGWGRVDAFRAILSIARGDVDNNGVVDIGDLTELIRLLFIVIEDAFPSPLLGDCDCNGIVDIGDVTELIDHFYVTLEPLPIPCYDFGD